jgi:hypothetical protein
MKHIVLIGLLATTFAAQAQNRPGTVAAQLSSQPLGQLQPVRVQEPPIQPNNSLRIAHLLRQRHWPTANQVRMPELRTQTGLQLIWQNDFSTAADWVAGKASGTSDGWVVSALGPQGTFSIGRIQSTSFANGFAKFDSDLGCSGDQHAWIGNAQAINLSGVNHVQLEFQQFYSKYIDSTFVDVSNDGTNWTPYLVNNQYSNNDLTPNPETVLLNISAVAANQATVYLRFRFYSRTATMGTGAGCGYAWMVDDVKIARLPDNDLVLATHAVVTANKLLFYGRTPLHLLNDSVRFEGAAQNFGAQPQTGVYFYAHIKNENGSFRFADTSRRSNQLLPEAFDTSASNHWYDLSSLPVGKFQYVVGYGADSLDASPINNHRSRSFFVTDTSYRLSSDFTRTNGLSTQSWDYAKDDLRMAVMYELPTADTITSVTIGLSGGSRPGALLEVAIRDTTGLFTNYSGTLQNPNSFAPLLFADSYVLTAADTAAGFVTIPIPEQLMDGTPQDRVLPAGAYYVSVSLFSNNGSAHVGVLDDESFIDFMPPYASLTYIPADPADPGSTNRWWTNGTAHAIFANFGRPALANSIEQLPQLSHWQLYPNPAKESVQLRFQLDKTAIIHLSIYDMQGRLVQKQQLGQLAAGEHVQTLEIAGLAPAMYQLRFQYDQQIQTQKLIIQP